MAKYAKSNNEKYIILQSTQHLLSADQVLVIRVFIASFHASFQ